jgi:hypothetical protein|tara:strand:- start:369 stop:542 length:174 start_codon:yes stop_codon:yes gene_type:complete
MFDSAFEKLSRADKAELQSRIDFVLRANTDLFLMTSEQKWRFRFYETQAFLQEKGLI